jgi:hypothetical protein
VLGELTEGCRQECRLFSLGELRVKVGVVTSRKTLLLAKERGKALGEANETFGIFLGNNADEIFSSSH